MIRIIQDTKLRTIRTPHRCFACGRTFLPTDIIGDRVYTKMYHQVNSHDGVINSVYHCETCDVLMRAFKSFFYDDCNHLFPEGCVLDVVNDFSVHTPEDLLERLKNDF